MSKDGNDLKQNSKAKIEDLYDYAKHNKRDTAAYVVMILGLILMFFHPVSLFGGILVGLIVGLYFSNEFTSLIKNRKQFIYEKGTVRSLVLAGTALAFLIAAPGIFIGAAITTALKQLLSPQE